MDEGSSICAPIQLAPLITSTYLASPLCRNVPAKIADRAPATVFLWRSLRERKFDQCVGTARQVGCWRTGQSLRDVHPALKRGQTQMQLASGPCGDMRRRTEFRQKYLSRNVNPHQAFLVNSDRRCNVAPKSPHERAPLTTPRFRSLGLQPKPSEPKLARRQYRHPKSAHLSNYPFV